MESYEKKYKELEGKIKKAYLYTQTESTKAVLEDILPELKESEDEKIRKSIIENLKGNMYRADGDYDLLNKQIAWLEKQQSVEEIVARCKKSWYNEGKIAGMAEGLTDDEKYQQGWHDATEKQGEKADNANKVEPKFKVKYAGREYNVLEIKESAGAMYYGIEDEPNHIDYIQAKNCEIVNGDYGIKNGSSYPTKPAEFSEQNPAWNEEDEKNLTRAIWYVENPALRVKDTMLSEWLKSIKGRVQPQPKQ